MTLSAQEGRFHNVKKIKRNKSSSSFLAFTSQDRVSLALFFMPFWCVLCLFHCFQIICSYLHFWKGIQYLFIVCTFHYFIQWVCFYLEFFPFWSLFLNSTTRFTDPQDYKKESQYWSSESCVSGWCVAIFITISIFCLLHGHMFKERILPVLVCVVENVL